MHNHSTSSHCSFKVFQHLTSILTDLVNLHVYISCKASVFFFFFPPNLFFVLLVSLLKGSQCCKHHQVSLLPLALSRFSESILEYLANLDKAPDPTVRKDTFSSEIYTAYDILFNSWLQSRDAKVQ